MLIGTCDVKWYPVDSNEYLWCQVVRIVPAYVSLDSSVVSRPQEVRRSLTWPYCCCCCYCSRPAGGGLSRRETGMETEMGQWRTSVQRLRRWFHRHTAVWRLAAGTKNQRERLSAGIQEHQNLHWVITLRFWRCVCVFTRKIKSGLDDVSSELCGDGCLKVWPVSLESYNCSSKSVSQKPKWQKR